MTNDIMLYIGSVAIIFWGIAHIVPTKSVITGFRPISEDNKRILTMEWISEGLAMCFIGVLVLITVMEGSQTPASLNVYRLSAVMLIIMAALTAMTGARTSITPIKVCPFIKTIVAVLLLLGSIL
ncbi:MAG: hypothetical protein HXS54_07145 [Theionarchaea archaeon]|nr:hypothetical protein [Theionarchaea archaeon]